MWYSLIPAAVIFIVLRVYFHYREKGKEVVSDNKPSEIHHKTIERGPTKENLYKEMRERAFSLTPDQLNIVFTDDKNYIYGTIIDWYYNEVVVSIVAFATGDASIYISSGAMMIGGFGHENIKKAVHDLLVGSQHCIPLAQKAVDNSLPDKDHTRFYLLTNNGTYFYDGITEEIRNGDTDWKVLFNIGQVIISLFRQISENRK